MAKENKKTDGYHARYKASRTWETNRKRKLERTLKAQPDNEQVKAALKSIVYRRKTPGAHGWNATEIALAKLFKQFTGWYDRAITHADPKVSQAALNRECTLNNTKAPTSKYKSMFCLEARLQGIK